jgi:rhamnose utilization protein RhaD (predicted bifunctional aldolase and dehydrogenase)
MHIPGSTDLERLVARSRLIGADPALVVHGGGNTSSKTRERDHLGRERDVLRIKGSGTDLKTIGPDGFPGLFLDELLPLREREAMSDEEMVAYLAHCMVEPGSRRPSIETLLHAFLPARHVDHVHADVICALANNPEPERHARAAFGDDVAVVPYIRPGFALSRQVAELAGARAVVLAKHGLVTWGETHEASYRLTLELVARAEAYLEQCLRDRALSRGSRVILSASEESRHDASVRADESRTHPRPDDTVPDLLGDERLALLTALRGRLSRQRRVVLHGDPSQRAFADRPDVDLVATAARATPDHILRIGARSAVVRDAAEVDAVVDRFERDYRAYFARQQERLPAGLGMLDPLPRVILVPGWGAIAAGADAKTARVNAEIAYRSHRVTALTRDAFGVVDWLSEADVFDFDYWPLELYKLASAPPPKALAGHVAVVHGSGPVVEAVATRLAADGAHLVRAGSNHTADDEIMRPREAVRSAVESFGGVDILVAAYDPPAALLSAFTDALEGQRLGGAILLVGTNPKIEGLRVGDGVRINALRLSDSTTPERAAEAAAFLVSPHAAGIDRVILPVN